jgi:predicted 2-oxoglutarate/Fe(II)-dependent dioxygenase YbiX
MFLPIQKKPLSSPVYRTGIVEIPNIITRDMAEELKTYALDKELSGLHRRGSKSPEICQASFYTCLVFQHNSSIYEILDPAWEKYHAVEKPNISFIEPYEIKSYVEGDGFSSHYDNLTSLDGAVERKINLVIQLSDEDEYVGGDLCIGTVPCSRKFGTGIFFPAGYLHEVTPITKGTRFSLIGHSWGPVRTW